MDLISIAALLLLSPGFFMVTVTDPAYPDQPLFEYDIGTNCPKAFQLDFTIATRGPDTYDKHFRVQIHDTFRTIHMNVFRPAPNITKETLGELISLRQHQAKQTSQTIFCEFVFQHSSTILKILTTLSHSCR